MTTDADVDFRANAVVELAQQSGWRPEEIEFALARVTAPLDGFKHSILSAEMMVDMARVDHALWKLCLYELDGGGHPMASMHPTLRDFTSKEGAQRRQEARLYSQAFRAGLGEARRHYAQAAFFQAQLGAATAAGALEVPAEEDLDDEEKEQLRQASELSDRIDAVVSAARDRMDGGGPKKAQRTRVKKAGKAGMAEVDSLMAEGGAEMAAAAEDLG